MKSHTEYARNAFGNIFRSRLKRWLIKMLRNAVDRADEWVHRQEVGIREQVAGGREYAAEVDPVASRKRERAIVKTRRPRLARLKYQHGEFVRSEAR
jgi:hypothetical protein